MTRYIVRCPNCDHRAELSRGRLNHWLESSTTDGKARRFKCSECGDRGGVVERVDKPRNPGLVVGSGKKGRHGKLVYHRPECAWAGKLDWHEMIKFASWKTAEFRGYSPCRVCKPYKD